MKKNIKKFIDIYNNKPAPTFIFDKRPVTYQTTINRVLYMMKRLDIVDKNIVLLGDDDLTGIAIAICGYAKSITVLDIDEMIKYVYDCGIEIYLSTNAYYLDKHFNTITKYVSCVGMPLDGASPEVCEKMTRQGDQIQTTLSAINKIKKANSKIKVKIGTVVSKINIKDLPIIKETLCNNEYIPDVWRLYEFSPLGEGKINRQHFEISPKEFLDVTNELKKEKNFPIFISTLTNKDSNDAYIFIEPNLDIITLSNDEYIKVGNAKDFPKMALLW